jgi:DNA-binding transcriptional regulator YiaG
MSILGPALRAELADVLGVKSVRDELRALRQELSALRAMVGGGRGARAATLKEVEPSITAAQVRGLRDGLGETRKAFAARLRVSPSIIFMWESGRSTPRRGAIVGRLRALMGSAGARPAREAGAPRGGERRGLKLSPKRRAALKLQGQYMGHLRNLDAKDKAQVKALKEDKGFLPAIKLAKKLGQA